MRPISTRELRWLLGAHVAPCVSIYLPADGGGDRADDLRRYERRVAEAAALLEKALPPGEVRDLLEPVRGLASAPFWGSREDALVVFRSRDVFTHYRVPGEVPELTVVADTFHSRPLVRYLNSNRRHFYVLALAPGGATLFEGTLDRLEPVAPEDLPPDLDEALAGAAALERGPDAVAKWFRELDRALWGWLKGDLAPLVLAAPDHHEAFRAASRYPELLDEGIEEDVAAMDRSELHRRALELILQRDADVFGALLAQLSSALSTRRASTALDELAKAAVAGRIRFLLVDADAHQWGRLDRRTGAIALDDRQRDAVDADVVDDLCEVVLLTGGDVHVFPAGVLPAKVAGIYRP